MISVILPTHNDARRLAACLAPLVPASMTNLVRELVIADAGSTDETLEIADDAGALILNTADLAAAIDKARGPWLLILDPSVRLEYGWEAFAKRHIEGRKGPARFRIEIEGAGLIARAMPPPIAAHLILKSDIGKLKLTWNASRLEARVGQVHVLDARGRI